MNSYEIPDPAPVLALLDAFRSSKVMLVGVSLKVFDLLEREPAPADRLAAELRVHREPLERLLDACAGLGLLRKQDGVYKNEPVASTYLSSAARQIPLPVTFSTPTKSCFSSGVTWKMQFDKANRNGRRRSRRKGAFSITSSAPTKTRRIFFRGCTVSGC